MADADDDASSYVQHERYGHLAGWWRLISSPGECEEEAGFVAGLLDAEQRRPAVTW